MKEPVVDPIAMVSAKIDNFFPNDEWDPETLIMDTNLDPEQTTTKLHIEQKLKIGFQYLKI